jgi:hypothetical protein
VNRNFTIRRLLAVLMIAGLALAPASRPVMAAASSQAPMQAMGDDEMTPTQMAAADMTASKMTPSDMSADMMDEMASEMPCCPSKAPAPVECDKCFFMAACGSVCFVGVPVSISHPFSIMSDTIALQRTDARPDGLGHPPPEHPPRSLV